VKDEKKDKKKPKISCTVSFQASPADATRASVSVSRGGKTYALGASRVRDGKMRVSLSGALPPGRYRIFVRVTDDAGQVKAFRGSIRVS
jgi:hypothetical protein